jgi:siderophore synthetase component
MLLQITCGFYGIVLEAHLQNICIICIYVKQAVFGG